jgi:TonB family protein
MLTLARKIGLIVSLLICVAFSLNAAPKEEKPLNQREVQDLVQNYVPSERIIELIHQFGISFEPSDQYLEELRKAGADSALIGALHAVRPRLPAAPPAQVKAKEQAEQVRQREPLSYEQVSNLLVNHIPNDAIADLVGKYGISFEPDKDYLNSLRGSGAGPTLLAALRDAKRITPPAAPQPAAPVSPPKEAAKTAIEPEAKPPEKSEEAKTAQATGEPAVKTPAPSSEPKQPEQVPAPAPKPPEHTGPYNVGGDVSPPTPLYTPNAPYTEQARRAHLGGTVVLGIVINEHGKVTEIQELSKPLGMGLDQSAIQTVGTWVFRAAQFRGVPVPVRVNVQVEFHQQN